MNGFGSDEPQPSVAPVKVDNQRYAFLILRHLQRMDPRSYRYFIHDLLVIFFTVDVTLYPRMIDWLKGEFGLESARQIVASSIKSWKTLPLHFEETVSHGWVVSCRSGGLKDPVESEKAGGCDSDEDEGSDEDDATGEAFVEEIQGVTEDGLVNGFLLAQIREGDSIQLNSHSNFWWMVHELRPRKRRILLSRQRTVLGPVVVERTPDEEELDEHHVVEESSIPVEGEERPGKAPGHFATRTITEYKEVALHALFGALVRREGVLTARTIESLERDSYCNFDFSLLTYAAAEEYNAQLTAATALKSKQPPRKSLKKRDQFDEEPAAERVDGSDTKKSKKKEYEDRRVVLIFKMPLPSVAAAAERMKEFSEEYNLPEVEDSTSGVRKKAHSAPMKDPIWHMQHQAQVQVWVTRWEECVRARKLLSAVDPYLCLHRDKWLLICKILRIISRGGDALLPDFISWTKKAGNDGVKRAKDASAAWASVRPVTTSDLQALSTARAYLRQRGAGHKKAYYDAAGRLRPEAMHADPKARLVLDAAALHMQGRVLTFFDQSLVAGKPGLNEEQDIDGTAAVTNCAIYEYDLSLYDQLENEEPGSRTSHIGTYLEERQISCFITVGDCLYVREPLTGQTQTNRNGQVWVLVLAVDLLFARIRVVQCSPDTPPPHCWSAPHHAPLVNSAPCWISISKLWDVTVCRELGESKNRTASTSNGLYAVWVTPMPSQHEALAVLSQLGGVDIGSTVLAPSRASASDKGARSKTKFKEYVPREVAVAAKSGDPAARQAEASRNAPIGTKSQASGKVKLEAVRFYVDSVIVQWHLTLDSGKKDSKTKGADATGVLNMKKIVPEFVIELTLTTEPTGWTQVYKGTGAAAQISGLEPLTQYYCRITVVSHPKLSCSCVVVTTLGVPPVLAVPSVVRWEKGTAPGSARGLVEVSSNDLPAGCFLQVEATLGDAETPDHRAAAEWTPAARTRNTKVWVVGPYSGHSVVLRTRIINQDGQPGPPSKSGVSDAPSFR